MSLMSRLQNCGNEWQGDWKRVLCVCTAGLLRSATAAHVLSSEPFNFNTRSAGLDPECALIPVDEVLLAWADEIVCMSESQKQEILRLLRAVGPAGKNKTSVLCLDIDDSFGYRDPELVRLIGEKYKKLTEKKKDSYGPNS